MFFKKLQKYILNMENKYSLKDTPYFTYDESTIISPAIAIQIYNIYIQMNILDEMWEKEKDYSRLLKKENVVLQKELNLLLNEEEDIYLDSNSIQDKEYKS